MGANLASQARIYKERYLGPFLKGSVEISDTLLCIVLMYVGGVVLLRNFPFVLCGAGSTYRINEIKRAGDTFFPDNRQGGP